MGERYRAEISPPLSVRTSIVGNVVGKSVFRLCGAQSVEPSGSCLSAHSVFGTWFTAMVGKEALLTTKEAQISILIKLWKIRNEFQMARTEETGCLTRKLNDIIHRSNNFNTHFHSFVYIMKSEFAIFYIKR